MAKCKVCGKKFNLIEWFTALNGECLACFDERMGVEGKVVTQWIYPSKLLSTPQSAFDFPEYLGLSVAMRLYIVVGKILWWLALLILVGFNIFAAVITVFYDTTALSDLLLLVLVSFLILLLMNLGLAFQFGSAEIIKVLIRNEENTRTVKKLLEKQLQTEDENKED